MNLEESRLILGPRSDTPEDGISHHESDTGPSIPRDVRIVRHVRSACQRPPRTQAGCPSPRTSAEQNRIEPEGHGLTVR